jgi:hypothetical protein
MGDARRLVVRVFRFRSGMAISPPLLPVETASLTVATLAEGRDKGLQVFSGPEVAELAFV